MTPELAPTSKVTSNANTFSDILPNGPSMKICGSDCRMVGGAISTKDSQGALVIVGNPFFMVGSR